MGKVFVRTLLLVLVVSNVLAWVPLHSLISKSTPSKIAANRQCKDGDIYEDFDEITQQDHEKFMNLAIEQAEKAGERGEVPIGAVIVERTRDGTMQVLSRASNLVETNHDASAHAELLAMRKAGKKRKNWRLVNTTLYTTLEPCPMCLTAAQGFRVNAIVYGAPDKRLGAIETHMELLKVNHPFHNIHNVVPGVMANESSTLLIDFFRARRKQPKRSEKPSSIFRRIKKKIFRRKIS